MACVTESDPLPPSEQTPRSTNDRRLGVLFVHGVGQAAHSDTLIDFGQAFGGWVARWRMAQGLQPAYGEAELSFTPYDAGSDNTVPFAELKANDDTTWVCAEAWYASSVRPLPFIDMLLWSVRNLWSLVLHLSMTMARRLDRIWNPSDFDAGSLSRFVDVVNCLALIPIYVVGGGVGYVLLLPLIVLTQIPYPPLQQFILVTFFRAFLQYNASELRVYIEDEIQAANLRRRVADAIDWLTDKSGGDCARVTIVAHSGGAWVAHGMLSDDTYTAQRIRVRKLVTFGAGLNKIWQLAPLSLERVRKPVRGDIFWVDFWGSYDPVPAGWLQPPRCDGGWYPIYEPEERFAHKHGLTRRRDPEPHDQRRGFTPDHVMTDEPGQPFWPDSIRVVNRMDVLTDHGGYFTNDEEILRRVAAEIDSDLYDHSPFWVGAHGQPARAIPRRRSRVAVLGFTRLLGGAAGLVGTYFFAVDIAAYLASTWPFATILSLAREVLRFIEAFVPPLAGGWVWLAAFVMWLAGAALSCLTGLAPYELFRAIWEGNDARQRDILLREVGAPPSALD